MFKKTYLKVKALAAKPAAKIWLAVISFIESSFFPIPADVMFIPMALARRNEAYRLALIATVSSVLGGIFGYFIGKYAYTSFALPMLEMLGKAEKVQHYRALIQQDIYLLWGLLLSSGLSHIPPIKVVTILAGAAEIALWKFIVSAVVGRGLRFYLLAFLIHKYGDEINEFIEKRLKLVTIGFCCIVIGGYILYKLVS
ncbi:MAG: membrane protein YqaA with SNARE-associated domain [Alphaproteobacteria bacterium]|jgi:membrane protein YqaA with SNARE-associated domain